jgi:transposase
MPSRPDPDCLTDEQWARIAPLMPGGCKGKRGPRTNNRRFIDALLWMARALARSARALRRVSNGQAALLRLGRARRLGVHLPGLERRGRPGVGVCRRHRDPRASARRRGAPGKRGPEAQGLGRSRGGLSTKLHAATDALGNPLCLIGGPGQQGEVRRGAELLAGLAVGAAIADTAYDAEHFHDTLRQAGARAVIKPRPNRRKLRPFDAALYRERNLVERFFSKIKHFRPRAQRMGSCTSTSCGRSRRR